MPKAKATKAKIKPPIEISNDKFLSTSSTTSTSSTYSLPSSPSSLRLFRKDKDIEEEVDKPSLSQTKKN